MMEKNFSEQEKSERLSMQVGGLIVCGINLLLALPPVLLALIFADNIAWNNWRHVLVMGGAWLAIAWPVLAAFACMMLPSKLNYFAALMACGWTMVTWGPWFMPKLATGLIH